MQSLYPSLVTFGESPIIEASSAWPRTIEDLHCTTLEKGGQKQKLIATEDGGDKRFICNWVYSQKGVGGGGN